MGIRLVKDKTLGFISVNKLDKDNIKRIIKDSAVFIFDEIAKTLPEQVVLLSLNRKNDNINLEGVAESNDYVSQFMRNLNNSAWFTKPSLSVIESGKKQFPTSSWFKLSVSQADIEKLAGANDKKAAK